MNKNSRLCERLKNDRLIDRLIEWLSEDIIVLTYHGMPEVQRVINALC